MLQKSATQLPFQTFSDSEESFYRNMCGGTRALAAAAVAQTQGWSFWCKSCRPPDQVHQKYTLSLSSALMLTEGDQASAKVKLISSSQTQVDADGGNVCFLEERSGRMLAAGINSGLLLTCGNNTIFMLLVLCRVHGLSTTHEYFTVFQIFSVKSFVKLPICETFI